MPTTVQFWAKNVDSIWLVDGVRSPHITFTVAIFTMFKWEMKLSAEINLFPNSREWEWENASAKFKLHFFLHWVIHETAIRK